MTIALYPPRRRVRGLSLFAISVGLLGMSCIDLGLPPLGPPSAVCSESMRAGFLESTPGTERPDLWLAFIDVGHGDATWVRTPGVIGVDAGEILIDAGDDGHPVAPHVPDGGRAVLELMRRAGLLPGAALDALVITHPDKDHYGGATRVLEHHPARAVIHGGRPPANQTWGRLTDRILATGAELTAAPSTLDQARALDFGVARHAVRLLFADPAAQEDNDASLVIELSFRGRSILLMGDAGQAVERRLLDRLRPVAILRTGHHGGQNTSSDELLERVGSDQTHAILSVGRRDGLPHPDVVDRLMQHFAGRVWRTDRGDATLTRRAAAGDDHIIVRVADEDGQVDVCFLDPDPLG